MLIRRGIAQTDPRQLIAGALAVSVLAIVADFAADAAAAPPDARGAARPHDPARQPDQAVRRPAADRSLAVDHVSLEVPTGEICVLLGPSGCGKTTTLKMINRIDRADLGQDLHRRQGHDRRRPGRAAPPDRLRDPADRPVPQHDGRGERLRRAATPRLGPRRSRASAPNELLEMVALDPAVFLKRYPNELSGGQAQRVGVARALAADPPVHADGRAVRRDRPDQPRGDPGRVPEAAGEARQDHHVRQPRHRRSRSRWATRSRSSATARSSSSARPTRCWRIRPTASSPISSAATAR